MKKILIALVVAALVFFAFFSIETNSKLDYLDKYQEQISFTDYKAHEIISVGSNTKTLKITFFDCDITKDNMENYAVIGPQIATETNENLNNNNEFNEIEIIFKPANLNGIRINDLISINELKYNYLSENL